MSDILFEILKVVVMVAIMLIMRYVVPWIKQRIGADQLAAAAEWARFAVLKAQQVMTTASGAERKAYVTDFLREILIDKNIALSYEQIDTLIEAAVKQMKIEEKAKITMNTYNSAGEAESQ